MAFKADDIRISIPIGRSGERNIRSVEFDISDWVSEFGEGTAVLLLKRSGESVVYPAEITQNDGLVVWAVTDTDTAVKGIGRGELVYTVGDKTKKGTVFRFVVNEALTGDTENPPEPYKTYVDTVIEKAEEMAEAAQKLQSLTFTDDGNGNIRIEFEEADNG